MALQKFIPYKTTSGDASLDLVTLFNAGKGRGGFVAAWEQDPLLIDKVGPVIEPVAGLAQIMINREVGGVGGGYVAIGRDGLMVREVASDYKFPILLDGTKQYVCLRVKYVASAGGEVAE